MKRNRRGVCVLRDADPNLGLNINLIKDLNDYTCIIFSKSNKNLFFFS